MHLFSKGTYLPLFSGRRGRYAPSSICSVQLITSRIGILTGFMRPYYAISDGHIWIHNTYRYINTYIHTYCRGNHDMVP